MKKPDFHAEFVGACMMASGYASICGYKDAARIIADFVTCDKKALTRSRESDEENEDDDEI